MKMKQMYEHYTVRTQQRIVQQLSDKVYLVFLSNLFVLLNKII